MAGGPVEACSSVEVANEYLVQLQAEMEAAEEQPHPTTAYLTGNLAFARRGLQSAGVRPHSNARKERATRWDDFILALRGPQLAAAFDCAETRAKIA